MKFCKNCNPIFSCDSDTETSAHFLLHCPNFSNERSFFLNIIGSIDRNILIRSDSQFTENLLYDDNNSNNVTNTLDCHDRFPNSHYRPGSQGGFVPPREGVCLNGVFEFLIICRLWNGVVKMMGKWQRASIREVSRGPNSHL